jgi:hypothetical protein
MTIENFLQSPWKRENTHPLYKDSVLAMNPAPEYANSEILLASLYRVIGFSMISEGNVPQNGKNFDKQIQNLRNRKKVPPDNATVDLETWNTVLHGVLESPKLPNQSSKRFLQVTPLVPQLATFSGSARLSSNSWPAGNLIRRMVWIGSPDSKSAELLWKDLFDALSVTADDDVFARWINEETKSWLNNKWELVQPTSSEIGLLNSAEYSRIKFLPARQFVKDLRAIIEAKNLVTRRQWTSLLESIMRIAAVTHITWLCDVQNRLWKCVSDVLHDRNSFDDHIITEDIFPTSPIYMTYGGRALNGIKDRISSYLVARVGINNLLWSLEFIGQPFTGVLDTTDGVTKLCVHVKRHHKSIIDSDVLKKFNSLKEQESRALNCKKGIGSNLTEFARHVLGQRQTAVMLLRGYDQGYVLKKKSSNASSPWILSLGPVAILALVHCALSGISGPRSIFRLGQHLAAYGIAVDGRDIARNDLGVQLRMLGLVLDSPDAESGMLLLPPFAQITEDKK